MDEELFAHLQNVEHVLSNGNTHHAIKMLEDLSSLYPDNYQISSMLGECFLSIGKPEKAIKPLRWSLKLSMRLSENKSAVKNISTENDLIRQLKQSFNNLDKDYLWFDYYLLGCAYAKAMKFKPAVYYLNLADQINPENTEILRNLGWVKCMQEKKEIGRTLLRKAIELDPKNALAYNDLGASYMFDNNLKNAEYWIKQARQLDPFDSFIAETEDKLNDLLAINTLFANGNILQNTSNPQPK